jgi:hypothetical protein
MSLPHSHPQRTVEEYLALERASEPRSEFLDGYIYLMAGKALIRGLSAPTSAGSFIIS